MLPDEATTDALMLAALEEARAALEHDDVPIGAVVARLDTGEVLARQHNRREVDGDPTAHAEILALREAARAIGNWRLDGCVLAVTLEPCAMCAGALVNARLPLLVFGATDPKAGAVTSLYEIAGDPRLNHRVAVHGGVRADACGELLTAFFAARRKGSREETPEVDR
ncbi:MAG TPA: nucleoside deaminase [Acidimicrobiia bacterium]|nr:nucleoside deaminase [Acidimicrobiia bacterium]